MANTFSIKKSSYVALLHHPCPVLITPLKAVLSVVFFLPAFVSPFLPTALGKFVLLIDVVFSYLYAPPSVLLVTEIY